MMIDMKCLRCKSVKTYKFLDGFNQKRIFCRNCWGSWPEQAVIEFGKPETSNIMKLTFYQNNKALRGEM